MDDMQFVDGLLVTKTSDGEPAVTWPLLEMGVEVCLHISEVANCPDMSRTAQTSAVLRMSEFLGCICSACDSLVEIPERWRLHAEER